MKTLKRSLVLALCCVMLLGMTVMSANAAAFTDADEIVNTEAVTTVTDLNIISGIDDGSRFDPTGIVTRAEMCKMICIALNGGKDPQPDVYPSEPVPPLYTDTDDSPAAFYIEYCTHLGIVAGRGDGTFDPHGAVTGTQSAKMLLIAIGYDADIEEFIGSTWAIAVNVRANQKNIYQKLESFDIAAPLSRDNAAQLICNALNAVMVEYEYKLTSVGDELRSIAVRKDYDDGRTLLSKKFEITP